MGGNILVHQCAWSNNGTLTNSNARQKGAPSTDPSPLFDNNRRTRGLTRTVLFRADLMRAREDHYLVPNGHPIPNRNLIQEIEGAVWFDVAALAHHEILHQNSLSRESNTVADDAALTDRPSGQAQESGTGQKPEKPKDEVESRMNSRCILSKHPL